MTLTQCVARSLFIQLFNYFTLCAYLCVCFCEFFFLFFLCSCLGLEPVYNKVELSLLFVISCVCPDSESDS